MATAYLLFRVQAKEEEKSAFQTFFKAYFYDSQLGSMVIGALVLIVLLALCFLKIQYRYQDQFLEKNLTPAQDVLYIGIMCQEKL